ncbi:Crp/Fnr family transcriptional regulator [Geobacter benzoatilyticus]|nr:Crp/Fnr family transcriptional regulator [Geobacter benzoatilyticus]
MKLISVNLLRLFETTEGADLGKEFRSRLFPRKALIYSPSDEVDRVFIVKRGRLRVYLSYGDREFTLALLEAGDIFSTHTRAFVQTLQETELLVTDTATFQKRVSEIPEVSQAMVKVLGELLKNSLSTIEGLVFKDARLRLIEFLATAAADRGKPGNGGITVELGLNTEDIALLVGTTRQTISTIMNDLIKAGIIEKIDRQTICVRRFDELTAWKDSL